MTKKILIKYTLISFLIMLISFVIYLYASPYISIYYMKQAIENRDGEALAKYIDFGQLKIGIKEQIKTVIEKEMSLKNKDNAFTSIETSVRIKLLEKVVDELLTPEGLPILMQQGFFDLKSKTVPDNQKSALPEEKNQDRINEIFKNASFGYQSLSQFFITLKIENGRQVHFFMVRDGWYWKLTDIRIDT